MRSLERNPSSARRRLGAGIVFAAMLTSCAGAGLIDVWKDPSFTEGPMQNVLVVVMKPDPARRRLWEDDFVQEVQKHGVTATPSYRLFPEAMPDSQQIVDIVKSNNYDGVIVTHKLPTDTQTKRVEGYRSVEPVTVRSPWSGAYTTMWREVSHPGYIETETVVSHQTDVWSTRGDGRLVWTATGESIDPSSSEAVSHEISHSIVPALAREGILPKKP